MTRIACSLALSLAMFSGCIGVEDTDSTVQEIHSWGDYHWARTSNPFNLKVGDNVTSAWDSYLNTTVGDWSQSTVLDMTNVAGAAKGRCRGTAGRVEVCNDTYGNNGWLGLASISITGGTHITQGTVKLNDTYFNKPSYNTTAWRNLVMCQEVGHTLGLGHNDENFDNTPTGTCMDYSNDPTPNQHPNTHDYDQLAAIYAHVDATTTLGQTTTAQGAAGESPAEWGHLMASSHSGQQETYVRDHGGGELTITFVTWAH